MPPPLQRPLRRTTAPAATELAGATPYVWFLSAALLVFVLDQAGFRTTRPLGQPFALLDGGLAAAVAVAWRRGTRWWPAVALAGFASALLLNLEPWWAAAPLYALGLVVAANSARILLEVCGFDGRVRHLTDVLALAALAAPAAGFIAAMLGAATPALLAGCEWGVALETLVAHWFSGWMGVLLLTPFLLSIGADYFERWSPARMWEWVLVNLLLVASVLAMMHYLHDNERYWFPMAYLALPWIFWTAWRFGPAGAALDSVLIGALVSLCAWDGIGPFIGPGLTPILLAWSFLGFHGFIALTFAAVTDERRIDLVQQRQRARFLRQVLDQLPCGVLLKDIHDKPVLVNRRWFQFFGKPGGTEEDQLRHQQSIEQFWRARELSLLQNLGDSVREESDSTDHEGKRVELLLTKQAAYFEERGDRLLIVVADEISRGRASLNELRATLARMHETLGVAEVSLWEWHIPTGIIRFDAQFSRLTSVPERPEGLAVALWQEGIHPDDRPYFQHAMLRHLHHQEELFAARFRFRRPEGWVWLVVRGRVVEQDVRKLGVRMIGTLQEARATVLPLPDPNAPELGK